MVSASEFPMEPTLPSSLRCCEKKNGVAETIAYKFRSTNGSDHTPTQTE